MASLAPLRTILLESRSDRRHHAVCCCCCAVQSRADKRMLPFAAYQDIEDCNMKSYTYARAFQAALIGIAMTGLATLATRTSTIMSSNSSTTVKKGRTLTRGDLHDAIMAGAVERVRPKMTVVAIMAGLPPIMWSTGTGSEIMQRIAVPMISGMILSTLLTLIVIPAIFGLVKERRLSSNRSADDAPGVRRGQVEPNTAPAGQ